MSTPCEDGSRARRARPPSERRANNKRRPPRRTNAARHANKPSSVPTEVGEGHFSGTALSGRLMQPTRDSDGADRPSSPMWPCSGRGLPCDPLLPGARCALTAPFHPCLCPEGPSAVYSLLHFPSPRGARELPGVLSCGARTFLCRDANAPAATLHSHAPVPTPGPNAEVRDEAITAGGARRHEHSTDAPGAGSRNHD